MDLPPLPPLNDKLHLLLRGPTIDSNWVIPGMVMAGAYPGAFGDRDNELNLKRILNKGIDTFVCLQEELDTDIPEEEWRGGRALRPYFPDARRMSKKPLIWRHLPIIDGGAADDDVMEALVCDLLDDVKSGKVLYVHCWGGHGRTGIVVCLLLAVLYGIPVVEAFKRVQAYHDCRVEPQGVKSPQTVVQRSQVKRLLQQWSSGRQTPTNESPHHAQQASEPEPPQLVVGKNGARGFIVPPTEQAASLPRMTKDETSELVASRGCQNDQSGKQQLACSQPGVRSNSSTRNNSALRRDAARRQSPSQNVPRLRSGMAAGTGHAAVQMIRKSTTSLALTTSNRTID